MENAEWLISDFFEGLLKCNNFNQLFVQKIIQIRGRNILHRPAFQDMASNKQRFFWDKQSRTTSSFNQRYMSLETVSVGGEEGLEFSPSAENSMPGKMTDSVPRLWSSHDENDIS